MKTIRITAQYEVLQEESMLLFATACGRASIFMFFRVVAVSELSL